MSGWLILGIGSPAPDDRIGWEAADFLRRRYRYDEDIEVELCDRPGIGLLAYFRRASRVIIVDAMHAGLAPGDVRLLLPEQLEGAGAFSSHDAGVAEALALADALGELPDRLVIIGIEAGGDLSDSIPRVHEAVQAQLEADAPGCR